MANLVRQNLLKDPFNLNIDPLLGDSIVNVSISKQYGQGCSASITFVLAGLMSNSAAFLKDGSIEKINIRNIEFLINNMDIKPTNSGLEISLRGIDSIQKFLTAMSDHFVQ